MIYKVDDFSCAFFFTSIHQDAVLCYSEGRALPAAPWDWWQK